MINQNFKKLQNRISSFCKERDWDQFHSPKNLAISISIEAAELLENFQWDKDNLEIEDKKKERISQEIADVLIYSIRLCEVLDLDPIKISIIKLIKMQKNIQLIYQKVLVINIQIYNGSNLYFHSRRSIC